MQIKQGKPQSAIFLDRDGVINHDYKYVHKAEDFIFIDDVFDCCKQFIKQGYLIVIITNQSGIARGYYSEEDFHKLNQWMLEQFKQNQVDITAVYYCPHHSIKGIGNYKVDCECRKPKPGMIQQAAHDHNINLSQSILIGDNLSDIKAGKAAGIDKNFIVQTGKEKIEDNFNLADGIFNSLSEIVYPL
jgi:D-glycero-D-manno-heptose 1,7-bisphosphate phosphatase